MGKGYLVGFFIGDGCFSFRLKYHSCVTRFTLDAKSESSISNFLETILRKATTYEIEDTKPRKRLLLGNVKTEESMLGILAGLLDSDGCVIHDKVKYLHAMISTRSKILALITLQLAKMLRIKATFTCLQALRFVFQHRPW